MRRLFPNICPLILALLWLCASGAWADVPPGYYNDAVGKKKAELKAAMHEIIGYAKVLGYGSGEGHTWEGFNQTDRRSDNSVIDRYSYETFYFPDNYGAAKGMNIEHSFPKSWWGGSSNQAYKDIHHLMPCESNINSRKSNYPIGVVTGSDSGNGCTKVGLGFGKRNESIKVWEPADQWKGDFARAYFYMATCYSNLTWQGDEALKQLENNQWPTLQQWTYELLLKWNSEDPVDDFERTRNDKVYSIQGNRNPFIDFPDLAEYIWGSKTDVAWNIDGTIIDPVDPPVGECVISSYSFETSYEPFLAVSGNGSSAANVWKTNASYKCAVANAFAGTAQASDAYLVSPEIDLTEYKSAKISFDHATGFNKSADASTMFSLVVTEDVQDALSPEHADWTELDIPTMPTQAEKSYTSFVNSGDIDLSDYCGKIVRLAFRYQSTLSNCWAWEVRNVVFSGEKSDATKIFDKWYADYTSPKQQVYTVSGMFVGNDVPEEHGIYIVREKNRTIKVMK